MRRLTVTVINCIAELIEALEALLFTMSLVLFDKAADLDHQVFDSKLGEAHINIQTTLKLTGDPSALNSPH